MKMNLCNFKIAELLLLALQMFMVYVDVARNLIGVKFSEIDLSSKVFIVTGCNTGIGQCKETITGIHCCCC